MVSEGQEDVNRQVFRVSARHCSVVAGGLRHTMGATQTGGTSSGEMGIGAGQFVEPGQVIGPMPSRNRVASPAEVFCQLRREVFRLFDWF